MKNKTANNVQALIDNAKAAIAGWTINADGNLERTGNMTVCNPANKHYKNVENVKQIIDTSALDEAFKIGLDECGDLKWHAPIGGNFESYIAINVSPDTLEATAAHGGAENGFILKYLTPVIEQCIKEGDFEEAYIEYVDAAETFLDDGQTFATGYNYN